jgi:hypothetical protein
MPHYRATYRNIVVFALSAQLEFEKFQHMSAWSQTFDDKELPFFAVATPRERKDRSTHGSSTRETVLAVVLKMRGGDDLEDLLDDLSIVAEPVILEALVSEERDCVLTETAVDLDGGSGNRVGTLTLQFNITIWPSEPITP